jgi:hypothetical protein
MIFTQPDSVISNVYDPQSLNRYSFERDNPYKYVDENGEIPLQSILNREDTWEPDKINRVYNLWQEISNTWNSNEFRYVRGAWSATGGPFYNALKSSMEIAARVSYGESNPFASQDLGGSARNLLFSSGDIALTFLDILGVGGEAITIMGKVSTASSLFLGTGLLETVYNQVNSGSCSIQYDQSKSSTLKSSVSSSSSSKDNSESSSSKTSSFVNSIKSTINTVVNFVKNIFGGLFH